jgi:hypothetical protein
VTELDGHTFHRSNFRKIEIEPGNVSFRVDGSFLLNFAGTVIVFYFGEESEVEIPAQIQTIGPYSFSERRSLRSVSLSPLLRRIGARAFEDCCALEGIRIPSSVEEIADGAFGWCYSLSRVEFGPASRLTRIGKDAFNCCLSIQSMTLPAALEFVGDCCFNYCESLSTLCFEIPSHLREMRSLPTRSLSFVEFPDSLEVLHTSIDGKAQSLTIKFSQGSSLREIYLLVSPMPKVAHIGDRWPLRAFVHLPSHRVRHLRMNAEFAR